MSPYGVQPGEHIPGPVLHRYLTDFAMKFGVYSRTRFNTKVESIEPVETGGWRLKFFPDAAEQSLETKKVIIATGLTSQPNFPQYPGAEIFDAPYFHVKEFCRNSETVKTADEVVVIGGAKSAFDTAYAYAVEGGKVHLVIRENGKGPVSVIFGVIIRLWLTPSQSPTGLDCVSICARPTQEAT